MTIYKRYLILTRLSTLIPKYARLPLLAALILNCSAYWLTRPLTGGAAHYDISVSLDARIPFVPPFIVIYVLAYVQWVVGYIIIARDSEELCYRVLSGEMISKLICCAFFLALPTSMVRPEVTGTDIFSRLTRLIYSLDTPDNLFPSIHCVESWLCFRGAIRAKKVGKAYKAANLIFTLLVFASVVLVKQHLVVDIISGLLVAELGQLLAPAIHADALLKRINSRFLGKAGEKV